MQHESDCKNSKILRIKEMETQNTMEEKKTITIEEVRRPSNS